MKQNPVSYAGMTEKEARNKVEPYVIATVLFVYYPSPVKS
jgi:hypothetical protein